MLNWINAGTYCANARPCATPDGIRTRRMCARRKWSKPTNNDRNFMKNHSEKERSILDRARPLVEQHSTENSAVWNDREAAHCLGAECLQGKRRESQPAPRRHDYAAGHVQEAPLAGRRSDFLSNCICSTTSTTKNRANLWTPSGVNPDVRRNQYRDGS